MSTEDSFIELIKENKGLIYKVTTLYTNTAVDRQDLYQEIVFQLWKSFETFRAKSKISTWMYRVALNTAIKHLKTLEKKKSVLQAQDRNVLIEESYDYEYETRLRSMYQHIYALNILERGIVLLLLEGKTYNEISQITGLTPTNVSSKLSRIKQKLKTNMQKQGL
ncbi:RNA polymerase sigma factor [Eudoraea chungangensis]|uniref:RNA polymerase sigma factor n=1 Tax=Eudoraea chungangensis TaxID=1481905 RepID=UPI0023ECB0C3|nr:sigma-70 family RNA polymerase sigma factor [Eudoraea chungangensis]